MKSSSLIQPFKDSFTGLSVGLPAREHERTMLLSRMISL